ncbi:hypothetical protein T10_1230 [Trichinella papuae]|uniref:Uncharacterized protein n=1 Tax=Trichinella papuae TaxID=268474 RepID=A0A0V1MDU7_9BILA|nr:hypothetical protein T10_1230 [Trichinella papuae]
MLDEAAFVIDCKSQCNSASVLSAVNFCNESVQKLSVKQQQTTVSNIVSFCLQSESSGRAQTDFQRDRCLPEKRFVRVIIDCGHKSPTDDLRVLSVLFKLAVLIYAWSSLVQCHQRLP